MSYTPTNWKSGDVVTSTKLNKIEQELAKGGVLVCTMDGQTMALDKTWQEIADAGFAVLSASEGGGTIFATINSIGGGDGNYHVVFVSGSMQLTFLASSADGYPVMDTGGGGDGPEAS